MKNTDNRISRELTALREETGATVRQLASALGYSTGSGYQHFEDRYKKEVLPADKARALAGFYSANFNIDSQRLMGLADIEGTVITQRAVIGTITSGLPLKKNKGSKLVTPPDYLPNPNHLEVYQMGDTSMNLTEMKKGAIVFVRPIWHFHEDYGFETQHGGGSYYLYKTREGDAITLMIRQHHASPGKQAIAMPCSTDQSFQPETTSPAGACDTETGQPPAESDGIPYIYGIVEVAQTNYIAPR